MHESDETAMQVSKHVCMTAASSWSGAKPTTTTDELHSSCRQALRLPCLLQIYAYYKSGSKKIAGFVRKQASGQPEIQAQITSAVQNSSTITKLLSTICSQTVEFMAEIISQCMLAIVPPVHERHWLWSYTRTARCLLKKIQNDSRFALFWSEHGGAQLKLGITYSFRQSGSAPSNSSDIVSDSQSLAHMR
jgi:hypothetical protein